jgi:hypothetical protein
MLTLVEYTTGIPSKATGRICQLPDLDREHLSDYLTMLGIAHRYVNGQVVDYHPDRWCMAYLAPMDHKPHTKVTLEELFNER